MTSSAHRARLLTASIAAAAALPLTGCAPFVSGDSTTSTTSTTTSTPSPTGAGRQLTEAEAEAALPTRPAGAKEPRDRGESKDRATDPQECMDVLRIGDTATQLGKDRVARASRTWNTSSPVTGHSFRVDSYSHPVGPELLDRAGSAMAGCDAFSLTGRDDDGSFDLRVLAEPLPVASLGEQNYAARITSFERVNGKSERYHLDYVVVRVGHNLVEVSVTHQDEDAGVERLEDAARDILDRLEETP